MTNLLDERIDQHQSVDWTYGHRGSSYFIPQGPIPAYRQYHRPIDSPEHLGCNRSIAADSVGRATLQKPVTRKAMSIIDESLEANRKYATIYDPALGKQPAPKIGEGSG